MRFGRLKASFSSSFTCPQNSTEIRRTYALISVSMLQLDAFSCKAINFSSECVLTYTVDVLSTCKHMDHPVHLKMSDEGTALKNFMFIWRIRRSVLINELRQSRNLTIYQDLFENIPAHVHTVKFYPNLQTS